MGFILIKFKFQLPLVSLLHETKSCSTHPRASAQEDAQWQSRFDWADREPHDPLHDQTFHLTDIRHGLCNISLWLAGRNLDPEPLHKKHLQFHFLDYTGTGDLEIYPLLGIWKINCFQTLLQCLCNSLGTGRALASCATSHRSCILELSLLWNNWNFLQAEVCTQSSVFPCKHTTAPLSFNYQKPAPTIYQAWHSIH